MAEDIVIITSDSEDDDAPRPKSSLGRRRRTVSIIITSEETTTSLRVSVDDLDKVIYKHFPFIREFYEEVRAIFPTSSSQYKFLKVAGHYVRILQGEIMNYPSKCRLLAKNVCRTMLLFRALSRHFAETPFYLQKISQLLAIYIYLELRYAEGYHDSKMRIADRIVTNIHLHLKASDVTYILRIFAYIPHMGTNNEIVKKIFKRLIPEPIIHKTEYTDRLYVQYLIAFYHWKDAESEYEDQQRVIAFANRFMKPKRSLLSNLYYSRHLPCFPKRDDATAYILTNLVFFNDLRSASLMDGMALNIPKKIIEDSEDMDTLTVDYGEVEDDDPCEPAIHEPLVVKENNEPPTAEWLATLAARAMELEVKLPPGMTIEQTKNDDTIKNVECVSLDSSDEDHWVYNEAELAVKNKKTLGLYADGETRDSFSMALSDLDLSTESPEECCERLMKELLSSTNIYPETTKKPAKIKTHSSNGKRITFKGISEAELKSVPSLYTKPVDKSISKVVVSENVVSGSDSVEQNTSKNVVPEKFLGERAVPEKDPSEIAQPAKAVPEKSVQENVALETSVPEKTCNSVADIYAKVVVEKVLSDESVAQESVSSEIVAEELDSAETVLEKDSPDNVVGELNYMDVTESIIESPESPDIITSIETDIIEEPTRREEDFNEKECDENDTNSLMVATSFAEVSSSLINDMSDNATEQPICTENIIDNTEVEKEAVTLSLNTYSTSYDSSEESDETIFVSHYDKPPIKTYLRRAFKNTISTVTMPEVDTSVNAVDKTDKVDKENSDAKCDSATQYTQEEKLEDTNKNAPNILFSGKVIPLREDENAIGGLTPSYLKVPESVEVSSQGSNVVFSMQGRRLSSFPPLMVMSPNEQSMPDFDADFFNENEETVTDNANESTTISSAVTTEKKLAKNTEVEKPPTKRRSVWFSDKNEYHEIAPRETRTSLSSLPAINTINSTINRIHFNKQQYQPSTITTSQPDINSIKIIPTSNTVLKRIIPNTTSSSSPDTAALKSAQEQDLVHRLFPELFGPNNQENRGKLYNLINPMKSPGRAIATTINNKKGIINIKNNSNLNSKITSNKVINRNTTQNNKRRKNDPPMSKSEFDNYLDAMKRKRQKQAAEAQESAVKEKQRERRMRTKNKGVAKSLLETTNDVKLKMKPVVVLERLCETTYTAGMCQKSNSVSVNNTTSLRETIEEIPSQITYTITSMEVLRGLPGHQTPTRIEFSAVRPKTSQSSCDSEHSVLERENTSIRATETSTQPLSIISVQTLQTVDEDTVNPERKDKSERLISHAVGSSSPLIESPNEIQTPSRLSTEEATSTSKLNKILPPNTDESHSLETGTHYIQPETSKAEILPTKEVKVKLRRCNFEKGYFIVANTAFDDLVREGEEACGNVKLENPDEKKNRKDMRKKGSAARKREAMKRIYQENPSILFLGHRNRRTFGENNHLSCINTPPPTPPSPSLSPAPQSLDTSPTVDDTSRDGSVMDSHSRAEPNNNHVRPTFPLLHNEDRSSELSRYLSTSSEVYQEYCDIAKIPREIEINKDYLLMYYEYLDNRDDDRAKTEMQKLMPLFESKLFNASGPQRKRKRFESCSSPICSEQRSQKLPSSESTSRAGCSSWSSIASKRRKTICSDLHYLNHSPDFLFDEEICSSTKAADSPTLEVMRLHTVERSVQPKPSTIVSSTVVREEETVECDIEDETPATNDPVRSPHLFSDCSSPTQVSSAAPTPVQLEFYMEREDCGSPSKRTNCESPPEVSRIAVSRTYSKSNMVKHVFVPPEIEKCIEEQSSAVVVDKEDSYNLPSTSKRHGSKSRRKSSKTKRIPKNIDDTTSNDEADDIDDDKDEESQEVNMSVATTSVKRTRRKTKTSHRRKKLKKH